MDFTFSEEQHMMAGAFRELTVDLCTPQALRALFEGRDTAAEERWNRLAELGLFGVLAPPSSGGLGLAAADFVLLAQEAGRAALPEPLTEQAALAVPALLELEAQPAASALLPELARGSARIAITHPQNRRANVPPGLTHWLLCEPETVTLAHTEEVTAAAAPSVDAGRRLFEPRLRPGAGQVLARGARAQGIGAQLLNRGAVFSAAQCLGVAERMIALAAEYAKERVQFGKPIGSYQAIKHHLASVQVKLEFARPVVYAAVTRAADPDPRAAASASHAKLAAGDAAELAARTAIQVHGAMGYSWEVDLHFYMKRAWALQGAWGDRSFHARRVQSLVCGGTLSLGPDQTFARTA
jgi:alkylation response protein AidB-like acyl-CoA dehydrogenase